MAFARLHYAVGFSFQFLQNVHAVFAACISCNCILHELPQECFHHCTLGFNILC